MLIFMVFNAIKKPFKADNFLFFSYFLDINFLFFEAQNIYFVPNCTGQPVTASVLVQLSLCRTWSETQKTGILELRLI